MIYGVYDAVHTVIDPVTGAHQLAIEFAGRVFVLGVDPELTANGNAWVLDLSNLAEYTSWRYDAGDRTRQNLPWRDSFLDPSLRLGFAN